MTRKKLIVLTVTSACAWPMFAAAAGASRTLDVGHWEVITPSSIDESAPQLAAFPARRSAAHGTTAVESYSASAHTEVITPASVDESAPWLTAADKQQRHRAVRSTVASLANPQTPWSPNESGAVSYADDMRAQTRHAASVEETRIAVASHNEQIARMQAEAQARAETPTRLDAEIDRLLLASPPTPAERDREAVAVANPALLDSRRSAVPELRAENPASDLVGSGSAPAPASHEVDRTPEIGPTSEQRRTETMADASAPLQGGSSDSASAAPPAAEGAAATGATSAEAVAGAETRVIVETTPPAQ